MTSSAVMLPLMGVISYRVLDISKAGLSFCYNGKAQKSDGLNMAMTFFSAIINAIDIPVQVICDTELNINHGTYTPQISSRLREGTEQISGLRPVYRDFESDQPIMRLCNSSLSSLSYGKCSCKISPMDLTAVQIARH